MSKRLLIKKLSVEDIWDLNYVLHEDFKMLEKFPHKAKTKTVFREVKLFFLMLLKSLYKKEYKYPKVTQPNFLYICGTINNYKVLYPLSAATANSMLLGKDCPWQIPKFKAYWYALPYFFRALSLVKKSTGYKKRVGVAYFEKIWASYGYYKLAYKLLEHIQPKVVVIANDHLAPYRCFMRAARAMNIKSVYVQHAGTAIHFPPLEFDYAFLDGQLSYENYLTHGSRNTSFVYLAGSPRFDEIVKIRHERSKMADTIGIAVNAVDEPHRVEQLVRDLITLGKKIIFRPHPGIIKLKKRYQEMANQYGMAFSDPVSEKTSDFLRNIHLLISNTSYIQFEAVLSGIHALQYQFSALNDDGYGFVKNKCVSILHNIDEVENYLILPLTSDQSEYIKKSIANYGDLLQGKNTAFQFANILNHEILE